jgi:hypothetical protein
MPEEEATPKTFYRIRDWANRFENNRTRDLKYMEWVAFPNPLGGDVYAELLNHPNGAAHWGFWCACVFLASKCAPRGTLLREGGVPHTQRSIALTCRIPADTCGEAAGRLIQLGWLEQLPFTKHTIYEHAEKPHKPAVLPHNDVGKTHDTAPRARAIHGTERNGTETNPPAPPSRGAGRFSSQTPKPDRLLEEALRRDEEKKRREEKHAARNE